MLFAFFGLWETTLAVAAGAASIPIIIHLLNRKRFRIVVWAAMKFLLAAQKQNTRRMRLEQLILLAVRTLLVLLVVLAMASVMPWAENVWGYFWPEGGGFVKVRSGRTYKIIVLDASLSMNQMVQGKTAFERARDLAVNLVRESGNGDGFSVLLMKDRPAWIVGEAAQDSRKVATEIAALEAGHGNTSVAETLNMVATKLAEASARYTSREVYFVTDMPQTTWVSSRPPASGKTEKQEKTPLDDIQKQAQTIFVDVVGKDAAGNLAVTDLRLNEGPVITKDPVIFSGIVQNFSKEVRRGVRVALLVGQAAEGANDPMSLRLQKQDTYDILPLGHETVNFTHTFKAPGTYAVQMRLLANDQAGGSIDALGADNARTIIVTVREHVPILLVNGKPAVDRFDQATEYLRLALNPFSRDEPDAPLRPKVMSTAQFADANEGDLASYDCIFLCDVGRLGTGDVRRLENHLRRGGGLVVSGGEQTAEHHEDLNRLLAKADRSILPARIMKKIQAPADHHFRLQPNEDAFREPPLKAFADGDDRLSLHLPRFRQYLQVKPIGDAKARIVMTFSPEVQPLSKASLDKTLPVNDPAIMEWNPPLPRDKDAKPGTQSTLPTRYRGKVVLLTSTVNMDWNSWPGSPSFGALMQELARLAVAGKLRERSLLCGQAIEEYLPISDEVDVLLYAPHPESAHRQSANEKTILEGRYKVRDFSAPPQKKRSEASADVNVFHWDRTERSGIYLLTFGRNSEELPVAVNFPATTADQRGSESDLTRVDKVKLAEAYNGWDFQVVTDPANVKTATGQIENENLVPAPMGPDIAHGLLLAVLVLLLLEVVLAWVFGHYSAVSGTGQVATGRAGPILVSCVAGVFFLGGAYILVNAAQTGDFMGFLPDGLRGWIESWMGIAPPAPGEATHWDPEFRTVFLRDSGSDTWLLAGLALGAIILVYFIYRAEAPNTSPAYKLLLGGLRLFLILITLAVLLPQLQVRFDRQGWPDVVLLIDDSRSMGEPDYYQDEQQQEAVKQYGEQIRQREQVRLPERIKALREEQGREKNPVDLAALTQKIKTLENQLVQVNSPSWRPTRLQLIQALFAQKEPDWLETLVGRRRMKVHIFHLDANGRAIGLTDSQGSAVDITLQDPQKIEHAKKAIAGLEAEGKESRLGTALKQVLESYRGSSLAGVIMLTDGVTTRDETIAQASEYAAQKGVPLFFVGLGDDHPIRDLKLHDLQVPDVVYVNDRVNFRALLTGQGYKDLTVPITLKVKDKDGKEKEVAPRKMITVDASGKSVKVEMRHQPTKPGRVLYIMEVVLPKVDRPDKAIPPNNTRLERTVDVIESKLIKVLYVETMPRYEFRFIKSLLERERPDEKKNRSVDLKVVLLDADADFRLQDKSALADFPATKEELDAYDVVILGDCDPRHPRLGEKRLRNLANFVLGEDGKGKRGTKTGGGLLMIAGPNYSPHAYVGTPLAAVLPIEPNAKAPPEPEERRDTFRLLPTSIGLQHQIFRLSTDEAVNQSIWQKLPPMYWFSEGYRLKPLAEVLAVHPTRKVVGRDQGHGGRLPLAVHQFVGSGRSMFYGFEETWRWRFRDNESYYNTFWIETVRFLSRNRQLRTTLRLDRQTPYRLGEPIKVIVQFPDNVPLPGKADNKGPKVDVIVNGEFTPADAGDDKAVPEPLTLKLSKMENSWSNFEGVLNKTREGKYHFWLSSPDVSKEDPGGQKPSADARVELPPGELDRLRMNQEEMTLAAEASRGRFYTLVNANDLLQELPAGVRPSLSTSSPPWLLWNHVLLFAFILFLLTAEWLLRKRKHLL